ncbi:hypothetical protein K9M47_00660 [Candidatus Gracilibacteria bacterium]|nr:hypothetical protein [Candidatus Gracilibacteria bacterium]MCF7898359.1 hypothetical protein [Candidatus Paceibacterota bacterium]
MKTFTKKIYIALFVSVLTLVHANAAYMYISAPHSASSNREPLALSIFLDNESDRISGLAGDFSFPSELFDVKIISTQNGIVPLWIMQPKISEEKSFDQRTHIIFEGIIPGGYSGVHNPYYKGVFPGIVFTVVLIPKGEGVGDFILNNIELHAYDSVGTLLPSKDSKSSIHVPSLTGKEVIRSSELRITDNKTVSMTISSNELVNDGAPYVYIHDEDPSRTIDYIEIAESGEYNPSYISSFVWRKALNPQMLTHTARTKYVHAKIVYTNNTYTFITIQPVENSQPFLRQSRILVYILVAISLLYFYGKNLLYIFSKRRTKLK